MSQSARLLYLIRHAATRANLERPYVLQGRRTDLQLSDIGRGQAEAARRVLENRSIHQVFSSPMRRARETAEIIAQPHNTPVQLIDDLVECDVGRWEGLSWETIRTRDPQEYQAFEADPASVPYAGGESFQQVHDRAVPAIERLCREYSEGNTLIVTHNIVARVYVAHVAGIAVRKARSIRQDNAGITVISLADAQARLVTLNSIFHLDGLIFD